METFYDKKKYTDGNLIPKLRAVLLGNSKVGKTSLIMRYLNRNYREEYFPTKELV
jgi:GTPase SAR1 family protein